MAAGRTSLARSFIPPSRRLDRVHPPRYLTTALRRAAVRLDPRALKLSVPLWAGSPQLLVHEGVRQTLERRLSANLDERILLSITDNHRTIISSNRRGGLLRVRLHHMFLDADGAILRSLALYLKGDNGDASANVNDYIKQNEHQIRSRRRRRVAIRTSGDCHDLTDIFDELNQHWFSGSLDAKCTWGRRSPSSRKRHSIRLGTYCAEDRLIRIHPVLDQPWVPRFFVAFIMFHEMLHHALPALIRNGKRCFHTDEFRAYEQRFPYYEHAIRWERRNLHRLLA